MERDEGWGRGGGGLNKYTEGKQDVGHRSSLC